MYWCFGGVVHPPKIIIVTVTIYTCGASSKSAGENLWLTMKNLRDFPKKNLWIRHTFASCQPLSQNAKGFTTHVYGSGLLSSCTDDHGLSQVEFATGFICKGYSGSFCKFESSSCDTCYDPQTVHAIPVHFISRDTIWNTLTKSCWGQVTLTVITT